MTALNLGESTSAITVHSPIGILTIFGNSKHIFSLQWNKKSLFSSNPLLNETAKQLKAYFENQLQVFSIPLSPHGTVFQKSVWTRITTIPFGYTKTYGSLAKNLSSSARAIGQACGRNPIPIIIPCHRIIGYRNILTGYSGNGGINTKHRLLSLEGSI